MQPNFKDFQDKFRVNELLIYEDKYLSMKKPNKTSKIIIPEVGFMLRPDVLYLGRTLEHMETKKHVPVLEGRSSVGRLGIYIHVTAGFGDIGFNGFWTLEITCVQPVIIYPFVEICQIYYHTIKGKYKTYTDFKNSKYQNNEDIQSSMLYKDFK